MLKKPLNVLLFVSCMLSALFGCSEKVSAAEYALTIDDPHLYSTPLLSPKQRNQEILKYLKKTGKKAMLFVCGKRVDSPHGKKLLSSWIREKHILANHSYSHLYFHSSKVSLKRFQSDLTLNHYLLSRYKRFMRFFRFPYLKEGHTLKKRDGMRKFMKSMKYRNGHVSIDASDWYIDLRLRKKYKQTPTSNLKKYRDYYIRHMWERAQYYDGLAKRLLKRKVRHTMLIHHNLLNALFLGDLIHHFKSKGWHLIDANTAYQDKLYSMKTNHLPAGESLLWSLARERKFKGLRYPAESGKYEKQKMNALGL